MNVFSYNLVEDEVPPAPQEASTKFVVDDNIGEAIHIHLRNIRLEMSIDDFDAFTDNLEKAKWELDHGNR